MIEIKTTYNCLPVWHEPQYFNPEGINFNHTLVRIDGVIYEEDSLAYREAVVIENAKHKVWRILNDTN